MQMMNMASYGGMSRIAKVLTVSPYRQYHASVWIMTTDYTGAGSIAIDAAATTSDGRSLGENDFSVASTQAWTKYDIVFNSQNQTSIEVLLGVWGATDNSAIYFDDFQIEEVGLLNMVRRSGCPVQVKNASTGTVYTEGTDYSYISDPLMGQNQWQGNYDQYHTPPAGITIPSGSTIPNCLCYSSRCFR